MKITKPNQKVFEEKQLSIGNCTLNIREHCCEIELANGKSYSVTTKEGDVLKTLNDHYGQVVDKESLIRAAWGNPDAIGTNSLPVAISNLRKVLEPENIFITNVPRKGYKLECSDDISPTVTSELPLSHTPKLKVVPKQPYHSAKKIHSTLLIWLRRVSLVSTAFFTLLMAAYVLFSWVSVSCQVVGGATVCHIEGDKVNMANLPVTKGSTWYISSNGQRYQVTNNKGSAHD